MKLEAGKYVRARNGVIFGPLAARTDEDGSVIYYQPGLAQWSWNCDGYVYDKVAGPFDLVEEVTVTPVAPKTATFYVAAWWADSGKASASVSTEQKALKHSLCGPTVTVELELPPKPEGMKP